MPPVPKDGSLRSPTYLAWIRKLPCAACLRLGTSEAHHVQKRSSGVTRDDLTIPVCRVCHMRCEGQTVVENGHRFTPVPRSEQEHLLMRTRLLWLETASPDEWQRFGAERASWRIQQLERVIY